MTPILSLILIGTSSLAVLFDSPLASKSLAEKSYELIGFNSHASELLACGGGGSGAYRKPPRPGHGKSGDSVQPMRSQPTSTDTKSVQTIINAGQT